MKKILQILLVFITVTGCTRLSKIDYITIEKDELRRAADSCGYFDGQWALLGRGNYSELMNEEIKVSFCSNVFYSKDLTTGMILPVIPLLGAAQHEMVIDKKWLRIKNLNKKIGLILNSTRAK